MPLEQLRAWREGLSQSELGEVERLEPDNFPLLANSELRHEHLLLGDVLRKEPTTWSRYGEARDLEMLQERPFRSVLASDDAARTRFYLALIERTFAFDAKLSQPEGFHLSYFFGYGRAACAMASLIKAGVDGKTIVGPTLEWFTCYRFNYYGTPPLRCAIRAIAELFSANSLPEDLRQLLIAVRGQCSDGDNISNAETLMATDRRPSYVDALSELEIHEQIDKLLGKGHWLILAPCEVWTREALKQLAGLTQARQEAWFNLLGHCQSATGARPSAKWLKSGNALLAQVEPEAFARWLLDWLPLVDKGRASAVLTMSWENVDERQRMHEVNATVLRGLLWLCPMVGSSELPRAIGRLAASAYRKIRGLGPRAVKVGNAAVYALSEVGSPEAVGQLAMLKARVKFGTALKEIEKAYNTTAERAGIPRDELEEMAVPSYGLTEVGRCVEQFGEFTAELRVSGTTAVEIAWFKVDGKPVKSVPAVVKQSHAEELKELQTAAKDIQRMLPAQRERLDSLFLQQREWPLAVWRERYLDHPLIGVLARRLIWEFTSGGTTAAGIWFKSQLVDLDLRPIAKLDEGTTVRLWHPIGRAVDEIVAWRAWLDEQQIQQPFKQAHREVYLLTDAERRTRTYSNRYAAHILKQHQFNALAALRGWKNKLRLMVDAEYPPAMLYLPKWNLRVEFWIEGIGDNYGTDTNESGVYLRVATDQVRFYRPQAAQVMAHAGGGGYGPGHGQTAEEPLPLDEIPPLVFSEVMRDVDLFVGVASVGNDPAWNDGGPEGRHRDYWQSFSFGDLTATAQTRKAVLERLVPKLKIAGQCSFADKFLVVRGSLRTYKIHLGSGNILMSPNDQYLCIVPKQGTAEDGKVFLPFEGDRTLSVILSKAFLLAADAKIKDTSIVSQIKR